MVAENYLILWASQTGSAEWIAKNIHTEATQRGYKGTCVLMDDYEKSTLETAGVIIFVSSNTGDGDPPDNALKFWRFLRRNKDKEYFANRQITLLGLGDTNYSNFNNTVKRIEKKCKELGATIFYEKGLADDAEGLENVVDPWIEKLWDALPKVLESQGPIESVDQVSDLLKATTLTSATTTTTTDSEKPDPYSMKGRKNGLPNGVEKYLDLPNSLIDKKDEGLVGKALELDYSGLVPGIKLTGLPKAPAASAQWTSLATSTSTTHTASSDIPNFVVTPTPIVYAPITSVKCLTTSHALKRTLLMELQVDDDLNFEPGDAFGVIAPNNEDLVRALITRLAPSVTEGYEILHEIKGENLPTHLQKATSVTMADILRYGVDLTSSPRKALLRMLADHTTDVDEKTRLMYICSKQGVSQFNALRQQTPTLLDILTTFPSCHPPMSRLLDLLPPHQPRYYSMANSPLKRHGKVEFAFNIVEYTTETGVQRQGVATPWLDHLSGNVPFKNDSNNSSNGNGNISSNVKIPIFTRPSNAFVLPTDTSRPLVLIGPGTGIAPLRGFVQHRQEQRLIRQRMGGVGAHPNRDILKDFGAIHVYDGCRDRTKDYLFEEEWAAFIKDGTVKSVRLAVSRQDVNNKVYVQDLIKQDHASLYDLIVNKDAAIYVCGDAANMARGVNDALVDILCQYDQELDTLAANKKLMEWMANGKYLRDLWA